MSLFYILIPAFFLSSCLVKKNNFSEAKGYTETGGLGSKATKLLIKKIRVPAAYEKQSAVIIDGGLFDDQSILMNYGDHNPVLDLIKIITKTIGLEMFVIISQKNKENVENFIKNNELDKNKITYIERQEEKYRCEEGGLKGTLCWIKNSMGMTKLKGGVWVRDFAPFFAKHINPGEAPQQGSQLIALDFNYFQGDRHKLADDKISKAFVMHNNKKFSRISLPVFFEGGNFLKNKSGQCFAVDKIYRENSTTSEYNENHEKAYEARKKQYKDLHDKIYIGEYIRLSTDQIDQYFTDYFGCKSFFVFKHPNTIATLPLSHIDNWALFVDDKTVVIAEITEKQIEKMKAAVFNTLSVMIDNNSYFYKIKKSLPHGKKKSEKISESWFDFFKNIFSGSIESKKISKEHYFIFKEAKDYLNEQAKFFESVGLTVERLTIPLPVLIYDNTNPYNRPVSVAYPTYLNALILNEHILVPRFGKVKAYKEQEIEHDSLYIDHEFLGSYEKAVEKLFDKHKLKVHWIDSDKTPALHGSLHCLTATIPAH